jgi:hypothetical protein
VYQACLAEELRLREIGYQQEVAIPIAYKGLPLDCTGCSTADRPLRASFVLIVASCCNHSRKVAADPKVRLSD